MQLGELLLSLRSTWNIFILVFTHSLVRVTWNYTKPHFLFFIVKGSHAHMETLASTETYL